MAVIGKIREKSGLLVFIVGLGLLLFIIPFDSIIQSFQGNGEQPLGEINGEEIMDSEWNFNERAQGMFAGYSGVPEDYKIDAENRLWEQLMIDTLLKQEVAKLGLQVSTKEIVEYVILGDFQAAQLREQFSFAPYEGAEKVFSKDSLISIYNRANASVASQKGEQLANAKAYMYDFWDLQRREARLKMKYNAMAKFAVIATNSETTKSLLAKNAALDISYVAKEANTVPDDSVKVTDADVKKYFEQNKSKVKWKIREDYRSFDYALIDIKPTDADKELLMKEMESVKIAFSKASNDSTFVVTNSDTKPGAKQQNPAALDVLPFAEFNALQSSFDPEISQQIADGKKGDVVGPFKFTDEDGNARIVLAKVRETISQEETEVRHILIATDLSRSGGVKITDPIELKKKEKLADSLVKVLLADNSKFSALAVQFTDDKEGFAVNKGYYNIFPEAKLVPEFKDFGLNNPVGSVKSVKTEFGYHVMEITKRGEFAHNYIALVDRKVSPSKETKMTAFEDQGLSFAEAAAKNFENAATKFNLVAQNDEFFISMPVTQVLGYVKPLVEWSFAEGRKTGDVSTPIETKDGKYLVAKLTSVANYGIPTYDAVKGKMRTEVLRIKKLDYLTKKLANAKTLEEASTILTGSPMSVEANKTITLDMDGFPGLGVDDVQAIAKTYLIENKGEVKVITGEQGVYVVVVNNKNFTPAPVEIADEKKLLTTKQQRFVESNLALSLFKMADVKDWRMKAKIHQANQNK